MSDLQTILDDSLVSAGPAMKAVFARDDRRLNAEQLREFWKGTRMFAVSTVGKDGGPHIAPVHVLMGETTSSKWPFSRTVLVSVTSAATPRIAITTWGDEGRIAIVYGRCSEVPETRREASAGSGRHVITMRIDVDRAYAMKPVARG